MDPNKTGAYLAKLRKGRSLTQQEVADRLGISNKTVSKWESGGGFPDISVLPALAELYGVTADEILAGEDRLLPAGAQEEPAFSQVEQYLSRRGDLRFRMGLSAAVLCVGAARLYIGSGYSILLLVGSLLAVWVGCTACSPADLTARFRLLLPVAAGQIWVGIYLIWQRIASVLGVYKWLPSEGYFFIGGVLKILVAWTGTVLLVPLVYAAMRACLRRRGGGPLFTGAAFRLLTVGWGALLCWMAARWYWEWPLLWDYASANHNLKRATEKAMEAYWSVAEPLAWIKWGILLLLALTLLVVLTPRRCEK